jgi:Flp pilus assembly protein TadG
VASVLERFVRERHGQAAVVETVIMMFLLIAFFGGFSAYAIASHARAVVIGAATAAGRAASIECGQGTAGWQADTVAIAETFLKQGGLQLSAYEPATDQPGAWYVTVNGGCATGSDVSVTVQYDQLDLFPFVAPLLGQGRMAGWTFALTSTAIYPVE